MLVQPVQVIYFSSRSLTIICNSTALAGRNTVKHVTKGYFINFKDDFRIVILHFGMRA